MSEDAIDMGAEEPASRHKCNRSCFESYSCRLLCGRHFFVHFGGADFFAILRVFRAQPWQGMQP